MRFYNLDTQNPRKGLTVNHINSIISKCGFRILQDPRKGLTVNHINSIISNIIRQPHKGLESKCGVLILRDPIL